MYTKLKKIELIQLCECLNLDTSGTKKVLMQRINDNVVNGNNVDIMQNPQFESTFQSIESEIDSIFEDNKLIDEQNNEFEQSLKNDKLKIIKQKIKENLLNNLSISELKLYLDSININYNDVLEKKELLDLLKQNCNELQEEIQEEIQEEMQEEIQLSIHELRNARLNYFNNLK